MFGLEEGLDCLHYHVSVNMYECEQGGKRESRNLLYNNHKAIGMDLE